jgi:hypothetical protein
MLFSKALHPFLKQQSRHFLQEPKKQCVVNTFYKIGYKNYQRLKSPFARWPNRRPKISKEAPMAHVRKKLVELQLQDLAKRGRIIFLL